MCCHEEVPHQGKLNERMKLIEVAPPGMGLGRTKPLDGTAFADFSM